MFLKSCLVPLKHLKASVEVMFYNVDQTLNFTEKGMG
jgi:hypothetical protein